MLLPYTTEICRGSITGERGDLYETAEHHREEERGASTTHDGEEESPYEPGRG